MPPGVIGKYRVGNQPIGLLWLLLDERGLELQAARKAMRDEYDLPLGTVRDTGDEVLKLQERGMVTRRPQRTRRPPAWIAFGGTPPSQVPFDWEARAVPGGSHERYKQAAAELARRIEDELAV